MAVATIDAPAAPRRRTRKAAVAAPPVPPVEAPTPVTEPDRAPLGSVLANVHVNLGGFVAFDAAVRGAVVSDTGAALSHLCVHDDETISPVEQRFQCPVCEKLGKADEFSKGQAKGDRFVVVPAETIAASDTADSEHKGKLTLSVHAAVEVNHALASGSVYYLAPNAKGTTNAHYATLARVLAERTDLAFVGVMATRKIAYRYLVSSDGVTITLTQLADPELVRERPNAGVPADDVTVSQLHRLLDVIVTPFDARAKVSQRSTAIADYVAGQDGTAAATPATGGPAVSNDLAASLQAALAAAGVTPIDSKRKRTPTRKAS